MDFSKVPKAKPISAKKAARYKKIFDDPQKMKEIFEQGEASSRWAEELKRNEQASRCKPDENVDEEEDDDDDVDDEEEEEQFVASKYFKKDAVMNTKEQEKKIEELGVEDGISNSLALRKQEEELVLPTKNATAKSIPPTESETFSHKAT